MSQAPDDTGEPDEDLGHPIPEPPRRVPFGVAVTTALLGMLALPLSLLAMVTLFSGGSFSDDVGEATLRGLGAAVVAVCAVLVIAVAWSFVRDGNTVGPMIVGLLVVITGLILLATGVAGDDPDTDGLRVGVLALVLGLGVLLVPLLGHGPAYLAARRVWSRAERDWLRDLTTPEVPPVAYPQQWPGHYPPPQQQWPPQPGYPGHPAQPGYPAQPGHPAQPGYPAQYQYPPQQGPAWTGLQPPQYQAWPEATVPPWSGQQAPGQPHAAPAVSPAAPVASPAAPVAGPVAQTASPVAQTAGPAAQTSAAPVTTAETQQPSVPLPAAQQAPTEQIRPADPTPPPQ